MRGEREWCGAQSRHPLWTKGVRRRHAIVAQPYNRTKARDAVAAAAATDKRPASGCCALARSAEPWDSRSMMRARLMIFRLHKPVGQRCRRALSALPSLLWVIGCDDGGHSERLENREDSQRPVSVNSSGFEDASGSPGVESESESESGMTASIPPVWSLTVNDISESVMSQLVPLAHPAALAAPSDSQDDDVHHMVTDEDEASWSEDAVADTLWYDSATGQRYEAMLVLGDGTAFGQLRRRREITWPTPVI
jgi:hypothetical protein